MKHLFGIGVIGIFVSALLFGPTAWAQLAGDDSVDGGADSATATLAGGCFWCVEADLEKVDGVQEVISGYAGGTEVNPTYKQVSAGRTSHVEAVQAIYDPSRVTFSQLLEVFWKHVDPTDASGQFVDRGPHYRTVIFYEDQMQRKLAEESKKRLEESGVFDRPIVTEIRELNRFYRAEDYHQDYYKRNAFRYRYYRWNSGRDQFLERVWKGRQVKLAD